ncbi:MULTISPECIES: EcsC family protein [Metabacillus]|uniref:EcsC family protein n=1 Tax=Metabacillus hrfriensis TaxID=3048891 RepID=A0ACD4RDP5_9BACI|nr:MULTISPECIES: EcsC family protein [Metabacillus]UAL52979.1 EcsC family protein [Metabacillus dongyingensis]USK29298.1 EcsC family protein [Bacillus sp. CMF21]WHZ58516.1 EcsC family protein [Metabacillus sp. CT-WN-B3]
METKEQLLSHLKEIEKWEDDQKGLFFWEKIGRIPFKLLDKLTPSFIQKKIGVLLDELGSFIQSGGKYLTQKNGILKKVQLLIPDETVNTIDDMKKVPLKVMNLVSGDLRTNRGNVATVQGATTGFGGIFTLAVDIPVLLGLSLKTLQEISVAYGYDPEDKEERIFIVKCLQFASADIVGKQAILNELSGYYNRSMEPAEMMSKLQGWREVVYTYRDQFGLKKLLQMVPVAGMLFGAYTNRSMVKDIAETGIMLYQKRRILERLESDQALIIEEKGTQR